MASFSEKNRAAMQCAVEDISKILKPSAITIGREMPAFEGFALFVQDPYHEDSAGAITQVNAPQVDYGHFSFQEYAITGRRVDLSVSTLGETFASGIYELAESRMNPEQHLVAGIHVPEAAGKRAAAVFQMAFTRGKDEASIDLSYIREYWATIEPRCLPLLETISREARNYPTGSIADPLRLHVPITPNAFVINWDVSESTKHAITYYPELRDELTLLADDYAKILADPTYRTSLINGQGDGQRLLLDIPPETRLSPDKIRELAKTSLYPLVEKLEAKAAENGLPVRIAIGIGRAEKTNLGPSGLVFFEVSDTSKQLPHSGVATGYTEDTQRLLGI